MHYALPSMRRRLEAQKILLAVLVIFSITFTIFVKMYYDVFKPEMPKAVVAETTAITGQDVHVPYDQELTQLSQTHFPPCQCSEKSPVNEANVSSNSVSSKPVHRNSIEAATQRKAPPVDVLTHQLSQITPCPSTPKCVETAQSNKADTNSIISIKKEFFRYLARHLQNTKYSGIDNYLQYIIAQRGLRSLDNVQSLLPGSGIVLNDVQSFNYRLSAPPCRPSVSNMSLFIPITSAPRNFEKRQMIRKTWLKHRELYSKQVDVVGVAFILGLTNNDADVEKKVSLEHATYGDILQVDMVDTYYNLSVKDTGLFNWLDKYCSSVNFYLRMDDDVYVNFNNLIRFMQLVEPSTPAMYGSIANNLVERGGRWGLSFEAWPWNNFPFYLRGPANLITKAAIKPLLAAAQTIPYHPFDDLFVSGQCAEKAGVHVFISKWFFVEGTPHPCLVRDSVTWLTDSSDRMTLSHLSTEKFYNGSSRCERPILDSEKRAVSLEEMFHSSFKEVSRDY